MENIGKIDKILKVLIKKEGRRNLFDLKIGTHIN